MATLSTVERRAINLTWAKPFDGNSPLMRYILEMSENSKVPHRPLPMSPTRPGQSGVWGVVCKVTCASQLALPHTCWASLQSRSSPGQPWFLLVLRCLAYF